MIPYLPATAPETKNARSLFISFTPFAISEGHAACFYFHIQNPLRRMDDEKISLALAAALAFIPQPAAGVDDSVLCI